MCWDFSLLSGLVGVLAFETQREITPESRVDCSSRGGGDLGVGRVLGGLGVLGGVCGGLGVPGGGGGGGDLQIFGLTFVAVDLTSDSKIACHVLGFSRKSADSRLRCAGP